MSKIKNILKNELTELSIATLSAKGTALLRDILFASRYGTGALGTAYAGASEIPPAAFELLFGCAIGSAFIPMLCRAEHEGGRERAESFAGTFSFIILSAAAIISLFGSLFSGRIIGILASGISGYEHSAPLLALLFPTLFINSFSYMTVAILHFSGSFLFSALVPVLGNITSVIYLIFDMGDIYGYAIVNLFSSLLGLLLLFKRLKTRHGFSLAPRFSRSGKYIKGVFYLTLSGFLPCALLPSLSLLSLRYSDRLFYGRGVALYGYAHRIFLTASGFFAFIFSTVLLPLLSRLEADEKADESRSTFKKYSKLLLYILIPITVVFAVFPKEIVSIIFMRGSFSESDCAECAAILRMLSLGIPFFAFSEIALKLCFAKRKCLYPSLCALAALSFFALLTLCAKSTESLSFLGLAHTLTYILYALLLSLGLKIFKRSK